MMSFVGGKGEIARLLTAPRRYGKARAALDSPVILDFLMARDHQALESAARATPAPGKT
jgi:hypothetical protein